MLGSHNSVEKVRRLMVDLVERCLVFCRLRAHSNSQAEQTTTKESTQQNDRLWFCRRDWHSGLLPYRALTEKGMTCRRDFATHS